jgi:glycerol uptake facilitator-like aquaporin
MVISFLESTMSDRIAAKLLAEFVGTFALIVVGAGAAAREGQVVQALDMPASTNSRCAVRGHW